MGTLQLALLGRPQVSCDNVALTGWVFRKSLALLAYLAVTRHPHDRGTLAGLFWPENTEAAAHANLRKVVSELHDRIPAHLTITRADLAFNPASSYSLDVETFQRVFDHGYPRRGSALTCAGAEALVEAIDLYRDDFLLGLALRRAPAFEEWALSEREHLRRRALQGLCALADYYTAEAAPQLALAYLERLLLLEPAHEGAHRRKMLLLAQEGQRVAAMRQYDSCRRALRALDAEPDGATSAIYRQLRAGATAAVPDVMTPAEAAAYLKVRPADIQSLISSGQVKAKQIGSDYRISKKVLDDFLAP